MVPKRATAVAVLMFIAATASAAECVTAAQQISSRASVPNLVAGPSAWNGTALAVAKMQEGAPGALWISLYGPGFDAFTANRQLASDAKKLEALLWNGSEFGLFYRTTSQGLNLQRVSSLGEPVGTPVSITPGRLVYASDDIDIVWSSALNAYAVGRSVSQGKDVGLWITLVGPTGAQINDRRAAAVADRVPYLDLAVTETGTIGAFFINSLGNLAFARATREGAIVVLTLLPGGTDIQATAEDGLFVVTRAVVDAGKTVIRWFIVDTSHEIVRPDDLLVTGTGQVARPLALISSDDALALAYIDAPDPTEPLDRAYRLLRFTSDGTKLTDTRFAAADSNLARAESEFTFAWTGISYFTAAVRSSSDRLNSYLLRYCVLDAAIVSPGRTVQVGQPVTFSAAASGGVPEYAYSWIFPAEIGPKKGQTLTRTFAKKGDYTVTLIVTDTTGASVSRTITITVGTMKRRSVRR